MSPDLESTEQRVANRIRDDLYRTRTMMPDTSFVSVEELHLLQTGWEYTAYPAHLEGQRTSWPIGWVRRLLLRLLFPSLKQQSMHAKVTSDVLLDVMHRLTTIERKVHDLAHAQPIQASPRGTESRFDATDGSSGTPGKSQT